MAGERRFHPFRALFALLFLAVLVYVGIMAYSAFQVYTAVMGAADNYETCKSQIESGDYSGAVGSVRSMADAAHRARTETAGWQWSVARALPVVGDDAQNICVLAEVSDDVSREVVTPLVQVYESATGGDYATLMTLAASDGGALGYFQGTSEVIAEAKTKVDNLPPSHIGRLNDAVGEVKGMLESVSSTLDSVNDVAGTISNIGSAVGNASSSIGDAAPSMSDIGSILENLGNAA